MTDPPLCLPKCRPASPAGFSHLSSSRGSCFRKVKISLLDYLTWTGESWPWFNFFAQQPLNTDMTLYLYFFFSHPQLVRCLGAVLPHPGLPERGANRTIQQLHFPQLPPAIPGRPAGRVEHQCSTRLQGQTLLPPLQLGAVAPLRIRLPTGNTIWGNAGKENPPRRVTSSLL